MLIRYLICIHEEAQCTSSKSPPDYRINDRPYHEWRRNQALSPLDEQQEKVIDNRQESSRLIFRQRSWRHRVEPVAASLSDVAAKPHRQS